MKRLEERLTPSYTEMQQNGEVPALVDYYYNYEGCNKNTFPIPWPQKSFTELYPLGSGRVIASLLCVVVDKRERGQ